MFFKIMATAAAGAVLLSASPALADDSGLYGTGDPSFDGVYRQSMAILAMEATDRKVPASALKWLERQQCDGGGFTAYRADTTTPCPAPDPVNFSGQDSNSTSLAIAALSATGSAKKAKKAGRWLTKRASAPGAWAYYPGASATPDANSSALATSALALVGTKTTTTFLKGLQQRCDAPGADRGGLSYDATSTMTNDNATAQTAWTLGGGLALPTPRKIAKDIPGLKCKGPGKDAASLKVAARGYVSRKLIDSKGALPYGGGYPGTDHAGTASATLALANAGVGRQAVKAGVKFLKKDAEAWITASGDDSPGALAMLILVAEATGENPKDFGGINLLSRLTKTRQ